MADLGPFRTIVDLQAIGHEWWLHCRWIRDWASLFTSDHDDARAKEAEYRAEWDGWGPTWWVWFEATTETRPDGTTYTSYATGVQFEMTLSFQIDEAQDWEPVALGDVAYYQKHFDRLGQVSVPYPPPKDAEWALNTHGSQLTDIAGFAITSIEKRQV